MHDQAQELRKLATRVRSQLATNPRNVTIETTDPPLVLLSNCVPQCQTSSAMCSLAERVQAELEQHADFVDLGWRVACTSAGPTDGDPQRWQQATCLLLLTDGSDESLLTAYTNLKLASPCPAWVEIVFTPGTECSLATAAFQRFATTSANHLSVDVQGYTVVGDGSCGLSDLVNRLLAVALADSDEPSRKSIASIALSSL